MRSTGLNLNSLDEDAVLDGDIYGMIAPYMTANFWVSEIEVAVFCIS